MEKFFDANALPSNANALAIDANALASKQPDASALAPKPPALIFRMVLVSQDSALALVFPLPRVCEMAGKSLEADYQAHQARTLAQNA